MDCRSRRWALAGEEAVRHGDAELELDNFAAAWSSYLAATHCFWLALRETSLDEPERRRLEGAHADALRAALPMLARSTGHGKDDATTP